MKPVNLLPADVAVASAPSAGPNMGMIGGAIAGIVAIVGVAGYFAMARVDTVKSETAAAQKATQDATTEAASITSQVQSLGQPIVDSDKQLAQGYEQMLVSAYAERHDFVLVAGELRTIMEGTGGWYESITVTSAQEEGSDDRAVKIVAYMPTKELAAGFNERVDATSSMENAETIVVESERLRDIDTKRPGIYFKFTIEADLIDTVSPDATGTGGGLGDATGTAVGSSGADSGELSLSLEPEPAKQPAAAAKPAKPKNPFDIAATVAGGGK